VSVVLIHIIAGLTAVVSGVVALSVTKGGAVHRTAGSVFVWSMVVMGSLGAIVAATRLHIPVQRINIVAGLFVAYLVTTSLITVRPLHRAWIDIVGACVAFGVAAGCFAMAIASMSQPTFSWFPAVPAAVFG
jgi:uncharacterized membrane protein